MKNWLQTFLGIVSLLILAPALHGQAVPAGIYKSHIQAGGGVLYLNNDYSPKKSGGLSFWGDYDFNRLFGLEAEIHLGGFYTPDDIGENSYLVGPRIMYHRRKLTAYGKIMLGRATITNQLSNQSSSFNVTPAYGGGVEYRILRKVNIRAIDFELQKWPGFEPHTLSPLAISVGVMYVIR